MAAAVSVNFRVGGVADVHQAFRSVEQSTLRAERAMKKMYDDDVRAAKKAADTKEKDYAKLLKWEERERQKAAKDTEKLLMSEAKAADKATAEKIKSEEAWAKQRQRIQENSARLAYRIAEKEVRDAEALERQKNQAKERFARGMGRTIGGSLTSLAGTAVNVGGSILALGGGFGVADAVQKQFALEREAALFSNQTSSTAAGRTSTKDIMSRARAVGLATNTDAAEVAKAMNAYFAKASDVGGAMQNAELFARLAKATGSDITQVATVAGALRVQNPNLDDKAMKAMLLNVVGQTRHGAVDVADLVEHVPVITASSALYGGDQAQNQAKLIGLSQVAMRTSGSSADAATAVNRFSSDIAQNADKIGAHGVKVKNSDGTLRDPAEIIADMMEKSKGDIGVLKKMGVGRESMRIFEAEAQAYRAKGRQGVLEDVQSFTNGGYDMKGLNADFANVMANSGERFQAATNRISEILQVKLAPYLEHFADQLPELLPKIDAMITGFGTLASAIIDHPIAGIGALIAGQLIKDIAAAQIGNVISAAIAKAMGTAPAGGVGGAGGGGGMNPIVGMAAVTAASAQAASISNMFSDARSADDLMADIKSGKVTPEQAQKMLADAQSRQANTGAKDIAPDMARKLGIGGAIDAVAGTDLNDRGAQLARDRELTKHADDIKKLLADLKTNGTSNPGNPNRNEPMSSTPRGGGK